MRSFPKGRDRAPNLPALLPGLPDRVAVVGLCGCQGGQVRVLSVARLGAEEFGVTHIADGLALVEEGGYLRLLMATRGDSRLVSLGLGAGTTVPAPDDPVIGAAASGDIAVQDLVGPDRAYVFASHANLMRHAQLDSSGTPGLTKGSITDQGYLFGVTALAFLERGATDLAVVAQRSLPGARIFSVSESGEIALFSTIADSAKSYLADVADLAAFDLGGRSFLAAISATEHGVSLFEIDAGGRATLVDALGAADGLPLGGPADLATVRHGGTQFLLVASSLSSSVTVLRVNEMGVMFPEDHLIDDRMTRFADVAVLDAFGYRGRAFVVAAGSDAGLTVLELLPDGRLSPVLTHALETGAGIATVTGIEVAVIEARAVVFLTDATGETLHRVEIDLSGLGDLVPSQGGAAVGTAADDRLMGSAEAETLSGGAGNDHLHDGAGGDLMLGGVGADVFVLARDGAVDRIGDFHDGVDLIDLSDWGRIYGAAELTITRTLKGAEIVYGTESLTITKISNGALDLTDADFLF